jgi:hypothetical protein
MDKINFYKKVIDKYFEKYEGNELIYKPAIYYFGAFTMLSAIMIIDNDLRGEEMNTIYNYFNERQHNAEN